MSARYLGPEIDDLSNAAERLRVAGVHAQREDLVAAALVVAVLVLALREGVDDVQAFRDTALRIAAIEAPRRDR